MTFEEILDGIKRDDESAILEAEISVFPMPIQHQLIAKALIDSGIRWLNGVATYRKEILWCVIRRFGSLSSESGLNDLIMFMRHKDPSIVQVSLQAIQNARPQLGLLRAHAKSIFINISKDLIDFPGIKASLALNAAMAFLATGGDIEDLPFDLMPVWFKEFFNRMVEKKEGRWVFH